MLAFIKRNTKNFFKDKGAVFASLLTLIIIIGLYALFLGDQLASGIESTGIKNPRVFTDSWIMAGLMAVMPLSSALGAVAIVSDRSKGVFKDFYCSPISRGKIILGYILSLSAITLSLTLFGLILGEIYIVANGGQLLSFVSMLKVVGVIILDVLASTSMIMFFAMFLTSEKAYSAICTVIGTLSGFIMGIYIPIGSLPESVGTVVKCFPLSHAGSVLRQIFMESSFTECFADVPAEVSAEVIPALETELGVVYSFGDHTVTNLESILILAGTAVVFFVLTGIVARRKQK